MAALRLWGSLVLGLHLLAYWLPEEHAWSVWPTSKLPLWLTLLLTILAAATLIPTYNRRLSQAIRRGWQIIPGKTAPQRWFVALSLLALPLFWLARIRHLSWGDAQILVIGLSHPEQTVIYNWQAPLTVFLHQRLWALVADPVFGWGVETVYALVSVLCGGLFVYVVCNIALEMGQTPGERLLVAVFVLTGGAMQLFFGYVENYTLISLGIALFLWLGLRAVSGQAPLWAVGLTLSLTNAFHPSTIVLWPAVLYLFYRSYLARLPHQPDDTWPHLLLSLILPPLIIGNSVLTLMELGDHGLAALLGDDRPGGGDHIWFVPLFAVRSELERYTMFSLPHLLDWANLHFLISPFGLAVLGGITLWSAAHRRRLPPCFRESRSAIGFLAWASLGYLLLTWVWNADYGVRKDWDLFSPSAFVYPLLAAQLLICVLRCQTARLAEATLIIGTVSALHTVTWVYVNGVGWG